MYRLRRFNTTITGSKWVGPQYLKDFLPRAPVKRLDKLHPNAKRIYNKMVQEPLPLDYKLYDDINTNIENKLGDTSHLPFQVLLLLIYK
jgi:hypothetical protein